MASSRIYSKFLFLLTFMFLVMLGCEGTEFEEEASLLLNNQEMEDMQENTDSDAMPNENDQAEENSSSDPEPKNNKPSEEPDDCSCDDDSDIAGDGDHDRMDGDCDQREKNIFSYEAGLKNGHFEIGRAHV